MNWINGHRKYLVAMIGLALNAADILAGSNPYVILAVSVATAAGVYQVPNARPPAAKPSIVSSQMGLTDPPGRRN